MHSKHLLTALALTAGLANAQNDECTGALPLSPGASLGFDTTSATLSAPTWVCDPSTAGDLWYTVTSTGNGSIAVDCCGATFDSMIEVFGGSCGSLTYITCSDDNCGLQSSAQFGVTTGTTYFVRVGGFGGATGSGVLTATFTPSAGGNDECAGATPLTLTVPESFDTGAASLSAPAWPCALNGGPDLWYRYTAVANGDLRVNTCTSAYDTALEVFVGSCGSLTPIACNDDVCGTGSQITWGASAGLTYFIRVGGYNGLSGAGVLTLEVPPPPALTIVNNLGGTWIDIASTGTPLSLTDDGEVDVPTTIGNALFAAGLARVGSNGGVRFDGTALNIPGPNVQIPAGGLFGGGQVLVPFWDDIDTQSGTVGEIYFQETQGRLIVQWQAVGFYNQPATERATFQLQVLGSGPIFAQFLYQDIQGTRAAGGGSATIGYQAGGIQNDVQWSFNVPGAVANGTVLSLLPIGGGGIGSNYCTANANSTGQTGRIAGSGSASVAANNLTLRAERLPQNAFGFFLTSTTQGFVANPGGSAGNLCVTGSIGRYVGPGQIKNSGASGSFSLLLNLPQTPSPGGFVTVLAGQTRNFQAWHRDVVGGAATSNFTDGLAVTFQ